VAFRQNVAHADSLNRPGQELWNRKGDSTVAVVVKNVSVTFPGVKALENASFTFQEGRIHAVLGANGSGKSTLVKVLTGIYHPDKDSQTEIFFDGHVVNDIHSPNEAYDLGARVVHQESPLIYSFSVEECIALFKGYPTKGVRVDWKKVRQYAQKLLNLYHINISPDTLTDNLSAADRNMVAMAMAMGDETETKATRILILDEADASIPEAETGEFLEHVRHVANMGIPVLMVTHRMKEVIEFCDDVTILNGGRVVYSGLKTDIDEDFIVSKMIRQTDETLHAHAKETGHSILELWELLERTPPGADDKPVLSVKNLTAKRLNGLSFSVKPGEILGVIGNPDSGVKELPQVLGGDLEIVSGEYFVSGKTMPKKLTPGKCFKAGVNVLPCDRPIRGGIMSCTLCENVLMPTQKEFWNKGKLVRRTMDLCIDIFDVQPRDSSNMLFGKFSGGNQQKAIMAKWISPCPKVLVLDDPTYGVDPASRIRIFTAMREAAASNIALIVFSTEPEQLAGICSHVIALHEGQVVAELKESEGTLNRNTIAKWCYT